MSGTSLDAVDGVLADFAGRDAGGPRVLAHASRPLPADLRDELMALNRAGPDELERAARASLGLVEVYACVVEALLAAAPQVAREDVRAIGAHGQTVRHRPDAGYTLQLNAPARLVEAVGIAVVADFRSRDVAAGGQGAPLVPAFHQAVFAAAVPRVILNLGGIANISILPPGGPVTGFDTGPANVLLDLWCARHTGQPYDADGRFAASGRVDEGLLAYLLHSEPWLALPPPKSTGRDLFHGQWLDSRLAAFTASTGSAIPAADVQATLVAFTAQTVAQAIGQHAPARGELYVCGGGAENGRLMAELAGRLPTYTVRRSDWLGIPAQQVEALAFAWLAHAHVRGVAGNLPAVTGAAGPRILGAYYPV